MFGQMFLAGPGPDRCLLIKTRRGSLGKKDPPPTTGRTTISGTNGHFFLVSPVSSPLGPPDT